MAPAEMGKQEALKKFAVDLTEQARNGDMDPILGRDDEIRQIIDILMRRRQNNPILTGEAGVGKTAVVEGFAQKIVSGDVPPAMRDVSLMSLDLGLLQAGEACFGARYPENGSGDDLGRVQKIFRERPGTDPTFSGGENR